MAEKITLYQVVMKDPVNDIIIYRYPKTHRFITMALMEKLHLEDVAAPFLDRSYRLDIETIQSKEDEIMNEIQLRDRATEIERQIIDLKIELKLLKYTLIYQNETISKPFEHLERRESIDND